MSLTMLAVAAVRDGVLPFGADECCDEAGGVILLVGTQLERAVEALTSAHMIWTLSITSTDAASVSAAIVSAMATFGRDLPTLVLPSSPDGRDLAPHLARSLSVPLFAGCVRVDDRGVMVVRTAGLVGEEHRTQGPFVATLLPGVRGVRAAPTRIGLGATVAPLESTRETTQETTVMAAPPEALGVRSVRVLPPDPLTADLAEAARIVAGGQGLGSVERFALLGRIGAAVGATLGGTRVASDAGWIPFERQIGTTGVTVDPSLYLAFAISGATQHTSGLGDPDHIVSVNLDGSCPMMAMADLAIVSDARLVLDELAERLGLTTSPAPLP